MANDKYFPQFSHILLVRMIYYKVIPLLSIIHYGSLLSIGISGGGEAKSIGASGISVNGSVGAGNSPDLNKAPVVGSKQKIEFTGLRNITGIKLLPNIQIPKLTTLPGIGWIFKLILPEFTGLGDLTGIKLLPNIPIPKLNTIPLFNSIKNLKLIPNFTNLQNITGIKLLPKIPIPIISSISGLGWIPKLRGLRDITGIKWLPNIPIPDLSSIQLPKLEIPFINQLKIVFPGFCKLSEVLHFPTSIQLIIKPKKNANACHNYWLYPISSIAKRCKNDPDVLSNSTLIMNRSENLFYNFIDVPTEDGYTLKLLNLQRNTGNLKKQSLLFINGMFTTSEVWIDRGNESIAHALAQIGYNIFIGNVRGSRDSRKHNKYTVKDKQFWDFNLDKIAKMDMAALINATYKWGTKFNDEDRIIIVTHSTGAIYPLMYASESPEEANKYVKSMLSLAPAVYIDNSLLWKIRARILWPITKFVYKLVGLKAYNFGDKFFYTFCKVLPYLCKFAAKLSYGGMNEFAPENLLKMYSYMPGAMSYGQIDQLLQIVKTGELGKMDYGQSKNQQLYGQEKAPKYDLSKIKWDFYSIYGKSDKLATKKNVEKLLSQLGSEKKQLCRMPLRNQADFGHMDFMYSRDPSKLVNVQLADLIYAKLFNKMQIQRAKFQF